MYIFKGHEIPKFPIFNGHKGICAVWKFIEYEIGYAVVKNKASLDSLADKNRNINPEGGQAPTQSDGKQALTQAQSGGKQTPNQLDGIQAPTQSDGQMPPQSVGQIPPPSEGQMPPQSEKQAGAEAQQEGLFSWQTQIVPVPGPVMAMQGYERGMRTPLQFWIPSSGLPAIHVFRMRAKNGAGFSPYSDQRPYSFKPCVFTPLHHLHHFPACCFFIFSECILQSNPFIRILRLL